MEKIKEQMNKVPEAIDPESYQEGQLTAISLMIMRIALEKFTGELREKTVRLAILLCDIDEEIINPTD